MCDVPIKLRDGEPLVCATPGCATEVEIIGGGIDPFEKETDAYPDADPNPQEDWDSAQRSWSLRGYQEGSYGRRQHYGGCEFDSPPSMASYFLSSGCHVPPPF